MNGLQTKLSQLKHIYDWPNVLQPGERVIVTEKIRGVGFSLRYDSDTEELWGAGEDQETFDVALDVADQYGLRDALRHRPGVIFYGVAYGPWVDRGLTYGQPAGEVKAAFHALAFDDGNGNLRFADYSEFLSIAGIEIGLPIVPLLHIGPYQPGVTEGEATGASQVRGANHERAGCVIHPAVERVDMQIGRVIFQVMAPAGAAVAA